jgi:hypothetical protein
MYFLRNPWHGPKKSIFAIFDDFRVFWMETTTQTTLPHFSRGSRKSSSFLRQLNGYLARGTFRNRKYKTALFFSNLNNELCLLTNKNQLSRESYLTIVVWSYPRSNLKYLVHFRKDPTPNKSRTVVCELKTQNRRLETITSLLIKTLANLEKEVEERRFYHYANNTDTNVVITISRRILLADWDCRAWMMDGCCLVFVK